MALVAWPVSRLTLWGAIGFAVTLAAVSFALSLVDDTAWDIRRPARATYGA